MLRGNLAQWNGFARAGARVQDVDPALFPLDRVEQTVEVVEIGRVAAHAGHVPANQLDGLVERLLPPARDEDIGTFFNEPLGARQRQAARSTRDDCNLTLKLSHDSSFVLSGASGLHTCAVWCGRLNRMRSNRIRSKIICSRGDVKHFRFNRIRAKVAATSQTPEAPVTRSPKAQETAQAKGRTLSNFL